MQDITALSHKVHSAHTGQAWLRAAEPRRLKAVAKGQYKRTGPSEVTSCVHHAQNIKEIEIHQRLGIGLGTASELPLPNVCKQGKMENTTDSLGSQRTSN